ncbi:WXG100 family type VII secretion target [Actinoplanes auranticolor]|uniref:Outer membrane channel protein CpnT-like N-terminal domain-containing protein n=1 Tax=Actinoplanes auranticolor TaxID=47988 RepID=A0A919SW14_9ACTN|nr:hypothetical protein [Actinoplanes auranticolor]GIM79522.1 hypothetical protein Aau02nite_86200 [Actinoplanes auranticolor]
MADNPLIAAPSTQAPSPWAGVWIAEDIEQIVSGVRSGSWIDGTLGAVSAGLDGLALVSDPAGALLQYGIAWMIEHVRPLSEALDWLAGDPAQIAAHAQTWRNVAGSLRDQADGLTRSVRWDVEEWTGAAASAYRSHADHRAQRLRTLALAADGTALMTEAAGTLIGTVRIMVRDAVATVVSRLIVYAGELIATAGLATPLVVEQVTTLCAAWAARIARWLKGLIASLRKLGDAMGRLGDRVHDLRQGRADASTGQTEGSSGTGSSGPSPGAVVPPTGPPWPARDDIRGAARGKDLNPPHARHTATGARHGEVRADNSVYLRGHENVFHDDVAQIAAGNAQWHPETNRYEINGRTYGIEPSGTVFPDSGPGIVKLNRNEYAALKEIARAGGDVDSVRVFTRDPRYLSHPEAIAKAKSIYDGTYPE